MGDFDTTVVLFLDDRRFATPSLPHGQTEAEDHRHQVPRTTGQPLANPVPRDAPAGAAVSLTIADLPDAAYLALVGDPSRCLTAEEAAEHLSVGRTTVYRLLAAGELLSITIGRSRRIPLSSIAAYVTRRIAAAVDGNADETLRFS